MNDLWKKLAAVGFLLFLVLWIAGFARTFALTEFDLPTIRPDFSLLSGNGDWRSLRQANNLAEIGLKDAPLPKVLDPENLQQIRVFEKTGQLSTGSTAFAEDEDRIRKAIATHKAVVFSQNSSGITPDRSLVLGIGIAPERFDALLQELTQVGRLAAINVQQQDRTSEFRKLYGQR